ncbi:uracil-DNA glycosylase [Helicobacter sp. MIT 21-1697]|uniref:uracil-DNA glycosylase n=1 Tax=Helicobacter sp. MIT 21-1697 TaxID=2993733 RepID=UPI00224B9DC8|nr:uracil-DNA glycosylase [Helicobacter sp. MIT 21-1697]MCX2717149.1 uracil-DNA glycosylase [Helicobacter sp. MIT 21-1697]
MTINLDKIKIPDDWKQLLANEFLSPYFADIKSHYLNALANKEMIYPKPHQIFAAFALTPLSSLKVVILGQDPYHGSAMINGELTPQAMGLSFSVPRGMPIPPSLKNIYAELSQSLHITPPSHGDLSGWARQGVLLLNAILSVRANAPASHKHFGWEYFSDGVIRALSARKEHLVFMLWGNYAKKKAPLIDSSKHKIITAPHPSPLARGFVGSNVFVQANIYLQEHAQEPIAWESL